MHALTPSPLILPQKVTVHQRRKPHRRFLIE
jgi:hypothetical protein